MNLIDRYIEAQQQSFARAASTQRQVIESAAELIADRVAAGGLVHIYDSGHIVDSEIINRAGGLPLFRQLRFSLSVTNPVPPTRSVEPLLGGAETGIGRLVLRRSNVGPNDTVIMGTVSGKSHDLIDLALAIKEAGIPLIAVTSPTYSSRLPSEHPSGQRLFEIADLVIDNCAPYGDAQLEVEGLANKFGPASGLNAAYLMWMLSAALIDALLARDIKPTVLGSVNRIGGREDYQKMIARFNELGY
ncbi:MAG: sugar isomerase domain-containing protein [Bacillota bacterium]|nr:sugar isomerase domain-containing protein [Bacillota bacterium]